MDGPQAFKSKNFQDLESKASRPLKITTAMPAKNQPADSGSMNMNTSMQINAVTSSLTASAITTMRKNALLSGPILGATSKANAREGKKAARLPNMEEYAATGLINNRPTANNIDVVDWIRKPRLINWLFSADMATD